VTVTMPVQGTVCNTYAKPAIGEPLYKILKSLALAIPDIL